MAKLRAKVQQVSGTAKHMHAASHGPSAIPDPDYVVIEEQAGAFYLLRFSRENECLADTWHLTVEEAKNQAEFEYGIKTTDWVEVTDSPISSS